MTVWRTGIVAALAVIGAMVAGTPPAVAKGKPILVAGLFGESDEEKAARLAAEQRENDQDAGIIELKQRVGDLEHLLQQITGQNELLTHRISEMQNALQQQKKDFSYKLCSLTAQLMGVGNSADTGGINCAVGNAPAAAPTVLANDGAAAIRQEYDAAMGLLARAQYDEARAAFGAFVTAHPQDDLAAQALYWVGNIAYVQKDYAGAAKAFLSVLKSYAKSPRAPESMFKLGQTLIALGQTKEGCQTLGALKKKYPKTPADIFSQADSARAASCK